MAVPRFSFLDRFRLPTFDRPDGVRGGNLSFDPESCTGCGICVQVCPGGCLSHEGATKIELMAGRKKGGKWGLPRLDKMRNDGPTLCIACFDCGTACPSGSVRVTSSYDPGFFFRRLTQTPEMTFPKAY